MDPVWAQAVGRMGRQEKEKAAEVKASILDDRNFNAMDDVLKITGPMYNLVRAFDTDMAMCGFVYTKWIECHTQMEREFSEGNFGPIVTQQRMDSLTDIVKARHAYSHAPIFGAAYVVNPAYLQINLADLRGEPMDDFETVLGRFYHDQPEKAVQARVELSQLKDTASVYHEDRYKQMIPLMPGHKWIEVSNNEQHSKHSNTASSTAAQQHSSTAAQQQWLG